MQVPVNQWNELKLKEHSTRIPRLLFLKRENIHLAAVGISQCSLTPRSTCKSKIFSSSGSINDPSSNVKVRYHFGAYYSIE